MDLILARVTGFCCFIKESIRYMTFKLLIVANLNLTELCLKIINAIGKIPTPVVNILKFTWKCIRFATKVACYCMLFAVFLVFEIIEAVVEW